MINKKAQIGDIVFVLFTLVAIAFSFVIGAYIYDEVGTGLNESGAHNNISRQAYDDVGVAFGIFDTSFVFIVIGLTIGLILSSFFIPSHPVFIAINIVGFLFLILIGAIFSNTYSALITQPGLNATALAYYPITTFVVSKLPFIGAAIVLLTTIIMYAKGKSLE